MLNNYFFIDGSALISQVREIQKKTASLKGRRLDVVQLISYFATALNELTERQYKRAVFYFPKGEPTVSEYLVIPDFKKPGIIRDLSFKYCGEKLKGSVAFNNFVSSKVPKKWQGRFTKSEKGIDIEICCDALRLAGAGKLDRLILLENDDDFVPLLRILKEFGTNISLVYLSELITPNKSLVTEADSYDVVPLVELERMFLPIPPNPTI